MADNTKLIKKIVDRVFDPFSELPAVYMRKAKMVDEYIDRAREAQKVVAGFNQEQIDNLVKAMAKVIYEHAEELANMAVEETGMGYAEHKLQKNIGTSTGLWNEMKGEPSVGVIGKDEEKGLIYLAKPMGVIGCVTPTTNPTITPLANGMCAIKCANALVVSPHPRSIKTTSLSIKYMNDAIVAAGGPENLIQCIMEPDVDVSTLLMQKADVILATGGPDMVESAYSSGKPSYGVGPGNSQSLIDRGQDLDAVADMVVGGRTFDLGVICAGNQCIHIHEDDYEAAKAAFEKAGAYWVDDPKEVDDYRAALFPNGKINKAAIGQWPTAIGKLAGKDIPEDRKALMLRVTDPDDDLLKEKLTTVIAIQTYTDFDAAVDDAVRNLHKEGAGHSSVLYSSDDDKIMKAALKLPVGRILVNQPGTAAGGNASLNGLHVTASLGCGSWAGNSISENLNFRHLMNISRISYVKPQPGYDTDPEELFK